MAFLHDDDLPKTPTKSSFDDVTSTPSPPHLHPDDDDVCSLCLTSLHELHISKLSCGHFFHTDCILRSLRYSPRCPICRDSGLVKNNSFGSTGNLTALESEDVIGSSPPETLPLRALGQSRDAQRRATKVRMLRRGNGRVQRLWEDLQSKRDKLRLATNRVSKIRRQRVRDVLKALKMTDEARSYFNAEKNFKTARLRYMQAETNAVGDVVRGTFPSHFPRERTDRRGRPIPPSPPHPASSWFWKV